MDNDMTKVVVVAVGSVLYFVVFGVPAMQIAHKAGYSRLWAVIIFVPLINIVLLWAFAFARWPVLLSHQQNLGASR
jgi:hypothetical protein